MSSPARQFKWIGESTFFKSLILYLFCADPAKSGCPCLPEGHASMSFHVNAATTDGKTDMLKVLAGGNNYYYPKNYGQGECAAWDTGLNPSCHTDPPRDWCKNEW